MSNFEEKMDKVKKAWEQNVQPELDKAGAAVEDAMDSLSDALKPLEQSLEDDLDLQKARQGIDRAAEAVGEQLEQTMEKGKPYMSKLEQAIDELALQMKPYIDKAKNAFKSEGESLAERGVAAPYKDVAKGIHVRCAFLLEDIGQSELSAQSKSAVGGQLEQIVREFEKRMIHVLCAPDMNTSLENLRIEIFGKNNKLQELLKSIGQYDKEDRKTIGQVINLTRSQLEAIYDDIKTLAESEKADRAQEKEKLDVSLPGKPSDIGTIHPISRIFEELCEIFIGMGFCIKEGPEVELDEYNFDKLNLPKDHPARDMQDTFYIQEGEVVLRTHTSPVQVRTMLQQKPPIRILSPGRVYRSDDIDATHSPIFHQMEGLVVDKDVSMAHLKGILDEFASRFFGEDIKVRLRPSFFPFTEPSAEVDLTCVACKGEGCSVCKQTGWIEVLGCGMVHPNVLRNCGIDPQVYSGLAFGMGLDRIANLKYKSSDIRLLYENDVRFLEQF